MKFRRKKIGRRGAAVVAAGALCLVGAVWFGLPTRAEGGPPQQDMAVDRAARTEVVEATIANLDRYYVFPETAAAIARTLRAQLRRGDFDSITSAETLAKTLTESMQALTHDKHLEMRYFEKPIPEQTGDDDTPDEKAAELLDEQRFNFGFESVGRLHGNIGYIDLQQFSRPQGAAERIASAMTLLADTKALVIDLRHCGGGDPDTVKLFASYLYDRPTHLNDIYWREGNTTEQRWTSASVPGKKYGEARKLYLLTSRDTFSACEDFAYALKNNHRAIVIGETTGGGAHPGSRRRLTAHFMMNVPSGRSINPVTHTDWEVVGVKPDVPTSAEAAQDTAEIAAVRDLIAHETDADWKTRLQHRLDDID